MKKNYLFISFVLVFFLSSSAIISPVTTKSLKSETDLLTNSIPDEVAAILKSSCVQCHANDGNHIAMTKLNFSKWDKYKTGKQAKKAAKICKEITKGAMPPKSFRESHPDAVPTEAQIAELCKWSESLSQK